MQITPKKSLGQNFLRDKNILQKIVDAGDVSSDDTVLEIGPGEGTLTEKILEKAKKVVAVEKDDRLIDFLKNKFAKEISEKKLELIHGDILELEIKKIGLKDKKYKLIANIPYYITGQIFRMFLESGPQPETMVLLVQKEVADRIMARDGKESILSTSVKVYGKPELVAKVGKGSFVPSPKVDSAILSIKNVSKKFFEKGNTDEKRFFEILKAGFAHKRKLLSKNIKNLVKDGVVEKLFDKNIRAEDLKVEDWMKLVQNI